jgi:DNA replication protein DnaC
MQTETPQPPDSSSPPSLSPALETELAERIERRRKELGIAPQEPKRIDYSKLRMFSMPEIDEAAEKAAEAKKAQDDIRAEHNRREAAWRNLCIGECQAYEAATVEGYTLTAEKSASQRAVRDGVAEYIATLPERVRGGDGFLFYGPCGTGKDHLAMAICRVAVLDHGFSVVRINGSEWYGRLRDLMSQDSASEANEIAALARPALLLISDPAPPIGDLTPYQASMLYRVLEKRQANGKATIVTANVEGAADAAKRLGAATMDRMRFKAWTAACNWKSYRKPSRTFGE